MKIFRFKIFGHEYETKVLRRDEDEIVVSINGQEYKAYLQTTKKGQTAKPTPKVVRAEVFPQPGTPLSAPPTAPKGVGVVKAPMPGLLLKVLVKPGDVVKAGQTVLVMEAMKMQNSICAPTDGTVREVMIKEGETIIETQPLLIIE